MRRSILLLSVSLMAALVSRETHANIDMPAGYDGRSVGMAGTGATFVENGASVYLNPAALSGVKTWTATADLTLSIPTLRGPLTLDGSSVKSSTTPFPLFLVGGAYRISPAFVLALAVYPTMGFGAAYKDLAMLGGERLEMSLAQFEISPAASYAITDQLSVGLGYRIDYTMQSAHLLQGAPPAMDLSLNGTSFLGLHVGVRYQALPTLQLALTYLSKTSTDLEGKTTPVGGTGMTTKTTFNTPHRLKAEVAFRPADSLLVAAALRYYLYSESNKNMDMTIETPMGAMVKPSVLDWKDVVSGGLGAEYEVIPTVPVRLGYTLSQSCVPTAHASPFYPSPGLLHSIHAGAGLRMATYAVDLGGYYEFGSKTTSSATPPGEYGFDNVVIAASFSYRPE